MLVWRDGALAAIARMLRRRLDAAAVDDLLRLMAVLRNKHGSPEAADQLGSMLRANPEGSNVLGGGMDIGGANDIGGLGENAKKSSLRAECLAGDMRKAPTGEVAKEAASLTNDTATKADGVDKVGSTIARGARGDPVSSMQKQLNDLGYNSGKVDAKYGPITEGAVKAFQERNGLTATGKADPETLAKLRSPDAIKPDPAATTQNLKTYKPGSPEQIQLFKDAARKAGLPESWAESKGLQNLLRSESNGQVGRPNYTYGTRAKDPNQWGSVLNELKNGQKTAKSSATGLGQLLLGNADKYYPSGRQGIGNPQEEAIGMMRYIKDRYGSPDAAWAKYNTRHEGY